MTWNTSTTGMRTAEPNDVTTERVGGGTPPAISIQSTRVQSGTYGFKFPHDGSILGNLVIQTYYDTALFSNDPRTALWVLSGALGVSAAPSANIEIANIEIGANIYKMLWIDTNKKLRVSDYLGNLLNDASKMTAIPTTGMQEFHVVIDPLTLSTVYIKIYEDGVEKDAFDTGLTPTQFFSSNTSATVGWRWGGNGINLGFIYYGDDLSVRFSTAAGDAPHLVAYPRFRGVGGSTTPPTSSGTYAQWTPTPAGSPWLRVDDFPNNGDTDYIAENVFDATRKRHTFKTSSANPTPDPCTVDWMQWQTVGRRDESSGVKLGHYALVRLAGTDSEKAAIQAATYVGDIVLYPLAPGGGAWVRANFDANTTEFGAVSHPSASATTPSNSRITQQCGPVVIYHTATIAAGTTPATAAVRSFAIPPLSRRFAHLLGR